MSHLFFAVSLLQVLPVKISRHALEALWALAMTIRIPRKLKEVYQDNDVKNLEVVNPVSMSNGSPKERPDFSLDTKSEHGDSSFPPH